MKSFIILITIYVIAGTSIALYVMKKKQSQEDYFIGGRGIGWLVTALTYSATTYSAFMMVGLVGLSYSTGIGAFLFESAYLVSTLILLSVYGKKIWQLGKDYNLVSPMELFGRKYGSVTSGIGTIISVLALIPYTSVQLIGLGIILGNFGISYTSAVILAAAIICLWSFIGGLRGVALTDALQGFFMLAAAIIAVWWAGKHFGGVELDRFPNKVWTPLFFINLTLPWCFFALTNPQVVQRLFIIKDKADFRKMLILFGLFGFLYTAIVTTMGFTAKHGTLIGLFPQVADRDSVIVGLLSRMSAWMSLPIALSIIFASVSTSNSIILTLSSMMTRDVFRQRKSVWFGRGFIIILTLLVALFSLLRISYVVELSVFSSRILLCVIPLFFGLFYLKTGGKFTGLFTLLGGFAASLLFGYLKLSLSSVYTLAAAFLFFFIGMGIDNFIKKRRLT